MTSWRLAPVTACCQVIAVTATRHSGPAVTGPHADRLGPLEARRSVQSRCDAGATSGWSEAPVVALSDGRAVARSRYGPRPTPPDVSRRALCRSGGYRANRDSPDPTRTSLVRASHGRALPRDRDPRRHHGAKSLQEACWELILWRFARRLRIRELARDRQTDCARVIMWSVWGLPLAATRRCKSAQQLPFSARARRVESAASDLASGVGWRENQADETGESTHRAVSSVRGVTRHDAP